MSETAHFRALSFCKDVCLISVTVGRAQ